MVVVDRELIAKCAQPVPRYTSYPTAPHFRDTIGVVHYVDWLSALPADAELSLYLHVPYCHELCWYCGCNTKAVQRYQPVARYLDVLEKEIENVAQLVPAEHSVRHIHWGGGSPNVLRAADIRRLADKLRSMFRVGDAAEFAIEIDSRSLSREQVDAFAAAGVNRISLGVQDFDLVVQAAINRHQSFETTERAVGMMRDRGVSSLNIDIVYGLPHQTVDSVARTVDLVIRLNPDRVAAFGYAHLPSRLKHQRMIDTASLPDSAERFMLADRIAQMLVEAGYVRVGLDHFARPHDELAAGNLTRNFQGYTTDRATALIGFGASSIGWLDGAYVQNATPVADYMRRIEETGLAVARGLQLAPEDRMRAWVIERLMCELSFSASALQHRFGSAAEPLVREANALVTSDSHGLVERTADGFRVTERGRPFVRSMCAQFDSYLRRSHAQHSVGV